MNILRQINQHSGFITSSQQEELNKEEQRIFEEILQKLEEDTEPEEVFDTLDVGEELTTHETDEDGEQVDNFGDPPSSPEEQAETSSQPSGSEYAPTPSIHVMNHLMMLTWVGLICTGINESPTHPLK